jgi:Gas vesicle synthesis protein GvpO
MAESSGNARNEDGQDGDRENRERRDGEPREALSAQELTEAALIAIADLTRFAPESVTGLEWDGSSWHASVDVLELARIPNSTDVLAIYDVQLDDQGTLLGYKRTRRFLRGQAEIER